MPISRALCPSMLCACYVKCRQRRARSHTLHDPNSSLSIYQSDHLDIPDFSEASTRRAERLSLLPCHPIHTATRLQLDLAKTSHYRMPPSHFHDDRPRIAHTGYMEGQPPPRPQAGVLGWVAAEDRAMRPCLSSPTLRHHQLDNLKLARVP